ncbi:uncharacterized protein LOC110835656 [Zootermopsis nevadensis]|uniref:uncharacterized protein LOC110835656 n=1 Tax=Zootermopsis nevadensis TaxID=136037 RepID=UPI000B8E7516|nr:uncharacterized protein LOC110835656 [Zootermopsis nevadensis]
MSNRQGGMMPGQNKELSTIYGSQVGKTESFEVMADMRNGNVSMGSSGSLPVYREHYCICTPKTQLEKTLIIVVVVLALITVVLIIVISVLAGDKEKARSLREVVQALSPKI